MNKQIDKLYKKVYPWVLQYILNNSGTESDAKDIMQDAMLILIDKTDYKCSKSTMLFGISKKLWLKKLRRKSKFSTWNNFDKMQCCTGNSSSLQAFEASVIYGVHSEISYLLTKHLSKLKQTDQKIIKMYSDNISAKNIAQDIGFTPNYVRKRVCICKSRLVKSLLADPCFNKFFY